MTCQTSFYFLQIPSLIAWWRCLEKWTVYGARDWEGRLAVGLFHWNRPPAQAGTREEVGNKKEILPYCHPLHLMELSFKWRPLEGH